MIATLQQAQRRAELRIYGLLAIAGFVWALAALDAIPFFTQKPLLVGILSVIAAIVTATLWTDWDTKIMLGRAMGISELLHAGRFETTPVHEIDVDVDGLSTSASSGWQDSPPDDEGLYLINPASGLPMIDEYSAMDIGGNLMGSDSQQNSFDSDWDTGSSFDSFGH